MATMICIACDWCGSHSFHAECSSGKVARRAIMSSGEWQIKGGQDLCPDCLWLYNELDMESSI